MGQLLANLNLTVPVVEFNQYQADHPQRGARFTGRVQPAGYTTSDTLSLTGLVKMGFYCLDYVRSRG